MSIETLRAALEWDGPEDRGVEAARALARWHLGDENWADEILGAYLDPAYAEDRIEREKGRRQ